VDPLPIVPGPGKGYGPPIHPVPIVPEPIKNYGPPILPVPAKGYGPPIHPVPIVPEPIKGYGPPVHPVPIVPPFEHVKPTYGLPPVPPPIVPVKPPKKTYGLPGLFSGLDKKPLKSIGFGKQKLIQLFNENYNIIFVQAELDLLEVDHLVAT
jgi:hypothetical protein